MPLGFLSHVVRIFFAPRTLRPIPPHRRPDVFLLLIRRHRHFKTTNSRRVPSANTAKPESKPTITRLDPEPTKTKPEPNPSNSAEKGSPRPRRRFLWEILALFPICLVIYDHFVPRLIPVTGQSMSPYLNEGYGETHLQRDWVIIQPIHKVERLRRGMVVIFPSLMDPEKLVVKRIIGMPGDRVTPRADSTAYPAGTTAVTIPWNHVWVEGDSDSGRLSLDSNSYGPISMNLISGLVVRVLLPRMRALRCQDWEAGEEGKQQRMRVEKNAVAVYEPPS